jgi:hypothetical protein
MGMLEHAHGVVVKNDGCITSHKNLNKRGVQAFYTKYNFFPGIAPLVSILLFPKIIDDFSLLIQKKKPTANSRYTVNKIVIFIEIFF